MTPKWEKIAILTSALAAFVAAVVAAYQGCLTRETIQISQATTRPFIVIEPASQPHSLDVIVLRAKNTGPVPARVLYESGKTWVASKPLRTAVDSASHHVLYPTEAVVLSEITLGSPQLILEGKQDLRIGFCTLYESISPGDTRRWVAESWFFFNPKNRKLEIWKRDEGSEKADVSACHIDELIPKEWFESLEPPWRNRE
ncbi:MAG: hypothetical protein C4520_00495 [Candidatus Abyssobacteria bacterium SURF_5]|uniref:Uncharacterized protein n=1 Tax=Abyssobacteria bacterium (strain SURF_5) TaxID=2093360 RepID=A0A3A4P659_ABYX5|nr:MAG: hypothetical protein C4520_00495 [Candidatus Abyssubacteria bacterium SURF_5]